MLLGLLYSEHDASSLGNMHTPSICVSLAMVHWQLPRSYTQDRCSNGVEINNRLLSGDQLLSVCYPCFSVFHSVVLYIQTEAELVRRKLQDILGKCCARIIYTGA